MVLVEMDYLDTCVDHDGVARLEKRDPDVRNHGDGCLEDAGFGFSDLQSIVGVCNGNRI